jgi:hypothetical protein
MAQPLMFMMIKSNSPIRLSKKYDPSILPPAVPSCMDHKRIVVPRSTYYTGVLGGHFARNKVKQPHLSQ